MEYQTSVNALYLYEQISANNYYKFINCALIKCKDDNDNLKNDFNTFCKKYNIDNADDVYSLLTTIKENDKHYNAFSITDSEIIGNLLFFIVYYMKQNPKLFKYMNQMLFLMKATCSMKAESELQDNYNRDMDVEKLLNIYERIDTMIQMNKNIETICKNLDENVIYKSNSKITHGIDCDYLHFTLIRATRILNAHL